MAQADDGWRWELDGPVQGEQVTLSARFPRSALDANAAFRNTGSTSGALPADEPRTSNKPDANITNRPSSPLGGISPIFCVVGVFMLIFLFSLMGNSARRRGMMGRPGIPRYPSPPFGGFPGGSMGRGFGRGMGRRFGRRMGRGYGGWGVPPIIPPSYGDPTPWGGNHPSERGNDDSGGGGFSWDDSGGGGTSWGDSGGGGSSWGDSGGGGTSWGDCRWWLILG